MAAVVVFIFSLALLLFASDLLKTPREKKRSRDRNKTEATPKKRMSWTGLFGAT